MGNASSDWSSDRLIRALQSQGWSIASVGHRHTVVSSDGDQITIPLGTRLLSTTVRAIIKQAAFDPSSDSEER